MIRRFAQFKAAYLHNRSLRFCKMASRPTRCLRWSGQMQMSTRATYEREARFEGDSGTLWCKAA